MFTLASEPPQNMHLWMFSNSWLQGAFKHAPGGRNVFFPANTNSTSSYYVKKDHTSTHHCTASSSLCDFVDSAVIICYITSFVYLHSQTHSQDVQLCRGYFRSRLMQQCYWKGRCGEAEWQECQDLHLNWRPLWVQGGLYSLAVRGFAPSDILLGAWLQHISLFMLIILLNVQSVCLWKLVSSQTHNTRQNK